MAKRGNYQSNRGKLTPDFAFSGTGLSLPVEEEYGQCSDCGNDGQVFTETQRCKECEIKEIARYLASQQP